MFQELIEYWKTDNIVRFHLKQWLRYGLTIVIWISAVVIGFDIMECYRRNDYRLLVQHGLLKKQLIKIMAFDYFIRYGIILVFFATIHYFRYSSQYSPIAVRTLSVLILLPFLICFSLYVVYTMSLLKRG